MKNKVSIMVLTLLAWCAVGAAAAQTVMLAENELLTDQFILEREYQNYQLFVSDQFAQDGDYLSISTFATSFGSDPDIYVSKVSRDL